MDLASGRCGGRKDNREFGRAIEPCGKHHAASVPASPRSGALNLRGVVELDQFDHVIVWVDDMDCRRAGGGVG